MTLLFRLKCWPIPLWCFNDVMRHRASAPLPPSFHCVVWQPFRVIVCGVVLWPLLVGTAKDEKCFRSSQRISNYYFFLIKRRRKRRKFHVWASLYPSHPSVREKKVEGFSLWGPSSVISSPQSRRSSQGFRCGRKSLEFLTTFLLRPRGRYTHSSHEKILDSFIPETKANRSSRVSLSLSPSFCKCSAISLSSCGTETTGQLAMSCRIAAWLPPSPVRAHCHPTLLFFFFRDDFVVACH